MCTLTTPKPSHPYLATFLFLFSSPWQIIDPVSSALPKQNAILLEPPSAMPHFPQQPSSPPAHRVKSVADFVDNLVYRHPVQFAGHQRPEQSPLGGAVLKDQQPIVPSLQEEMMGETVEGITFLHGIASGDPLSDSVILWTKVTPPSSDETSPITVHYEVSSGEPIQTQSGPRKFQQILQSGSVTTGPEVDYTVKINVEGLAPSTQYYYHFIVKPTSTSSPSDIVYSPMGITRTLPDENADISELRMAIVSCSNGAMGFFNSYGNIAERTDIDVVVHLGDYIYEYADGEFGHGAPIGRTPEPNVNLKTLSDYRKRHAQYKRDPDLQAIHAAHPFIVIWDDHEFADNIDGTGKHDPRTQAGIRAYFEYLPIRVTSLDHQGKIYRTFKFGNLLDLVMLDTRIDGRDETDLRSWSLIGNPNRTILGDEQEQWFLNELSSSQARSAKWRIVGNQVVFSPLQLLGHPIGVDSWDGYPTARKRITDFIKKEQIDNVVFLTGDIHASFVFDIPTDPFSAHTYDRIHPTEHGSLAVEFVGPSISSPTPLESVNLAFLNRPAELLFRLFSPHLHYVNMREHGYMICSVKKDAVKVEYRYTESVRRKTRAERLGAVASVRSGEGRVVGMEVY